LVIAAEQYAAELSKRLAVGGDPYQHFSGADESFWLWVNTAGYQQSAELQAMLPSLPSVDLQHRFTGKAGDETLAEGHAIAAEIKAQFAHHNGPLTPASRVLEFGCGWGRIIRYFLKDTSPGNLWGIDVNEQLLAFCKQSNPYCHFERNDPLPPTKLSSGSFDLIYAYSVFTHLSENAHLAWLAELRRLLKPGGVVVATVRPRGFIKYCDSLTADSALSHVSQSSLIGMFADTSAVLNDYDEGRFCYEPYRSSSYGDDWGEAVVSRAYIEARWTDMFELLDVIEDPARFKQNLAVLRGT
jgi:SAM-dependent methyltransferase